MAGVYISYPFCGQKCTYCNFASGLSTGHLETEYIQALLAELAAHAWAWRPETVYLGGGSPSRMESPVLEQVLASVPGRPWREATIEAAPGEITPEKAGSWRDAGITRVSLGVQSFVSREIARTGRKHNAETVSAQVALLRQAGIHNINIDLIAGLPGQTEASWRESLAWVERLNASHVSVYMLEVDEDSRLGRELIARGSRYGSSEVPSDEAIATFYEIAVERLAHAGILRYEISNFARPGEESLHNLKYWRLAPYAGFGADAHSFDGSVRRWNAESPSEYVRRRRQGLPACVAREPARHDEERFFVGLRLSEGIQPRPDEWRRFEAPISRHMAAGLLERDRDRLRLTERGILLSNEVFQEFITR
jgi:oxygen-independent coproporphyrinogen-3 oxidase